MVFSFPSVQEPLTRTDGTGTRGCGRLAGGGLCLDVTVTQSFGLTFVSDNVAAESVISEDGIASPE